MEATEAASNAATGSLSREDAEKMARAFEGKSLRRELGVLNEQELADALGLQSLDTLATWRSKGSGPKYAKPGKTVYYLVQDVKAWLVASVRDATLEATRQQYIENPELGQSA